MESANNLENLNSEDNQKISKKKLKRMKREEEWFKRKEEIKKKKKEKEKNKIKEKVKEKDENMSIEIKKPRKIWEEEFREAANNGIKVIIDCGFDEIMTEKEIISIGRQLIDCYAIHKKCKIPFNLIFLDVPNKVQELFDKNNFDKWLAVQQTKKKDGGFAEYLEILYKSSQTDKTFESFKKENIIYLTADSENTLSTIDNDKTYIIGGFVDRNRHKLLTLKKAEEYGLGHAKLPISEYMDLKTTKVLTTNHVYSILTYFNNKSNNWEEAFKSILPKRKLE